MRKQENSPVGPVKNQAANQVKTSILAHIEVMMEPRSLHDVPTLIALRDWVLTMDDRAAKVKGGLGRK